MQFKGDSQRLKDEWNNPLLDTRLRTVLLYLDYYLKKTYNIDMVVTQLWRAGEEQEATYGVGTKKVSVHQYWRGGDVRTRNWGGNIARDTQNHLNLVFKYSTTSSHQTAFWHALDGDGDKHAEHLHVQVSTQKTWEG